MGHSRAQIAAAVLLAGLAWGFSAEAAVIEVTGNTAEKEITGGYSQHGGVSGNEVHVRDGASVQSVTGGRSVFEGAVRDNLVTISGTVTGTSLTNAGSIWGGRSGSGPVTGNAVCLDTADVSGWNINEVIGGDSDAGTVEGNRVSIVSTKGLDTRGALAGGRASYGVVTGNTVEITGSTVTAEGGLYGGLILYGPGLAADGNAVKIHEGSTIVGNLYGGYNPYGDAAGNHVTIDGGSVNADGTHAIRGGAGNGIVSGNDVTIRGGTVGGAVYGGQGNGTVAGNAAELSGGMVRNDVYGGQGDGTVSGNTVTLSGSTLGDGVILYGGQGAGTVNGNQVIVDEEAGTIKNTIYGGTGTGTVNGNAVELRNGTVAGTVFGGRGGTANGNAVTLSGGTIAEHAKIYGGQSESRAVYNAVRITGGTVAAGAAIYGGSGEGTIAGNTVDITGGTVAGTVYGAAGTGSVVSNVVTVKGEANVSGTLYGGYGSGTVAANVVVLADGKVTGDVYAGASSDAGGSRDVKYNLMTLSGGADVSEAHLYGYNGTVSGGGNTLVVDHTWESEYSGGNFVQSVQNFDALVLQDVTWSPEAAGNDTPVIFIGEGDLTHTTVRLVLRPDSPLPTAEGHMDLIHIDKTAAGEGGASEVTELESRYKNRGVLYSRGVAVIGRLDVYDDDSRPLDFQVGHGTAERNPQTNVIADSQTASLAFLNQGADLAADSLDLLDSRYGWGLRTFGLVYGNRSRYDAAGGFRIHGWSEIAGVGGVHPVRRGELAWGVFYENGTGRYDAHNSFLGVDFTGRGRLLYNGGGAAVRLTKDSGVYYEASFRAGTLKSSMSDAVMDGKQNFYGFDSRSSYWGAHAGAGWKVRRGSGEWDLYGNYFHTAVDGDRFTIGEDEFVYDGAVSDRVRLGARYTARAGEAWSPYFGLAWQYEFRGDSRMLAAGFEAPERSLRGGTVIGEAGAVWRPSDSPWRASFLLRGYAGEREGFSGTADISCAF